MSKNELKRKKLAEAGLTAEEIDAIELWLLDVHRIKPRAEGGEYTPENYMVLSPEEHLKTHDNWREREHSIENLRMLVDERTQFQRTRVRVGNQLKACQRRTDKLTPEYFEELEGVYKDLVISESDRNKILTKWIKHRAKVDPFVKTVLGLRGVGEVTVAYCLAEIDFNAPENPPRHPSSLWQFVGLGKPASERYKKGKSSGGNKKLRTALFNMADSQVKLHGPYRAVYDQAKAEKERSSKIVKSNMPGKPAGIEMPWSETKPSHRDGHAKRMIVKAFLADYFFVYRHFQGLPFDPVYAETDHCEGNHKTVDPRGRGWEF